MQYRNTQIKQFLKNANFPEKEADDIAVMVAEEIGRV
jgi:hypothetical protein